jgi:hypothetical protein
VANGSRIPQEALAAADETLSEWAYRPPSSPGFSHGLEQEECLAVDTASVSWPGTSRLAEGQLEALEQSLRLQSLLKARREVEALPSNVWRLLSELAYRNAAQERRLDELLRRQKAQEQFQQQQQAEIAELKRRLQGRAPAESPVAPDEFQRWMMNHREEVAKHRGQHIAIHASRGIVAAANDYATLVEELERKEVPDDEVVIEFIRPTPSLK